MRGEKNTSPLRAILYNISFHEGDEKRQRFLKITWALRKPSKSRNFIKSYPFPGSV